MKWSEDKVLHCKKLKEAGLSNREIAMRLGATHSSINSLIIKKGLQLSTEQRKKISKENIKRGRAVGLARRVSHIREKFGDAIQWGWLAGICKIAGKCDCKKALHLYTIDPHLADYFVRVVSKIAENKICIRKRSKPDSNYRVFELAIFDTAVIALLKYDSQRILSRLRLKIHRKELGFWQGMLQGVFDARGVVRKGNRAVKAIRLYTALLPPGAVRIIRLALKRFRIKYTMQGGLSKGERQDYDKINRKFRRYERRDYKTYKYKRLYQKLVPKDYFKRLHIKSQPALKIKMTKANLERFRHFIGFHQSNGLKGLKDFLC